MRCGTVHLDSINFNDLEIYTKCNMGVRSVRPIVRFRTALVPTPVVRARAAFALRAARHTILDPFPLAIPKRITIHGRSPSLESDLRLRRNPKSLNRHHDLIRSKPFGRNHHDEIFGGICERQCQFRSRPSTFLQTDEHFHHRDFDFSSAARNRLQFDMFLITCRGHRSLRSAI